jgi:hypothetical protein
MYMLVARILPHRTVTYLENLRQLSRLVVTVLCTERTFVLLNNYCYGKHDIFPKAYTSLVSQSLNRCWFTPRSTSGCPKKCSHNFQSVRIHSKRFFVFEKTSQSKCSPKTMTYELIARRLFLTENRGRTILMLLLSDMMQCGWKRMLPPATYSAA